MRSLLDHARASAMVHAVATLPEHSGIMIALVPRTEDARRLALETGVAADELHVTLFYYGDASAMPIEARQSLVESVRYTTERYAPLVAKTFGVGVFNPLGDEPALILNVGGESIDAFRRDLEGMLWPSSDQHRPWAAHLTLAQPAPGTVPSGDGLAVRMGPVMFDRVRIAFAGEAIDIPFVESLNVAAARAARVVHEAQRAGATLVAHRGVLDEHPALTAHRAAIPVVRIDGDQVTFPVVAFVEGVRRPSGASGAGLFLASEFARALPSAQGMPVVFRHPTRDGHPVSVNDPPFDPGTGIPVGFLIAEEFQGGRMLAQAAMWLSKLRQAGPEAAAVGEAIAAGQQVEVSIGHRSREHRSPGVFNGEAYDYAHTDIAFDHLALLPIGMPGACSCEMGCGTCRT